MKYLAACCAVKNESSHVLEWMAFHRAIGFEHLVIIDHNSTDNTAEVVASFSDQSSVTLIPWRRSGDQIDMINWVVSKFRNEFFWCAFIDCDEFLYPSQPGDIKELMTDYEAFGAVGVHWLVYGSSGHKIRPRGLTIENYTRRSIDNFIYNSHVKSIVKMLPLSRAVTSHIFETRDGTVDENMNLLPFEAPHGFFEKRKATFKRFRINHYHTRSREDYEIKAHRGFFGVDDAKLRNAVQREAMFNQHDRNEVEDSSALRNLKLTKFYMQAGLEASPVSHPKRHQGFDALFDSAYYLLNNPDVAAANVNPLDHYLQIGWKEGRNSSAAFDTNAYLSAYPDVRDDGIQPLLHYLLYGMNEGRTIYSVTDSNNGILSR